MLSFWQDSSSVLELIRLLLQQSSELKLSSSSVLEVIRLLLRQSSELELSLILELDRFLRLRLLGGSVLRQSLELELELLSSLSMESSSIFGLVLFLAGMYVATIIGDSTGIHSTVRGA